MESEERLLQTIEEFSKSVGVSIDTVRVWVRNNKIPSFKIGKRRLINIRKLKDKMDSDGNWKLLLV